MKLKDIPFANHRQIWASNAFLKEYFKIKNDKDIRTDNRVKNFLYQINRIPIKRDYTLAGYGSLLNEMDVPRTLPDYTSHRYGLIKGFKRVFNMGNELAWLNVIPTEDANDELIVALVDFPYYELPRIISRESNYDFHGVSTDEATGNEKDALIVIADEGMVDDTLEPIMNYLHLCISGIKNIAGLEGINNFLDTTYCYSPDEHQQITIREYLTDFDLTNHMIKHEYISR